MNNLVTDMNNIIRTAVQNEASQVVFIDWSPYAVELEGRFCEARDPETVQNRYGLLFYNWYTDDNSAPELSPSSNAPPALARSGVPLLNGSFEWKIDQFVRQAQAATPNLQPNTPWQPLSTFNGATASTVNIPPNNQEVGVTSGSITPDSSSRIFHPRPSAHQLIANLIIYHIAARRAEQYNVPYAGEWDEFDTCPVSCHQGIRFRDHADGVVSLAARAGWSIRIWNEGHTYGR